MQSLISIIIPVYKVERYLRQCIDSVLAQTYTNLEIILVDDGSTDTSPAICDEYAARDERIIAIHKENGGLSSARNAGLDAATGDFIYFLDSDDYIGENTISTLYNAINKNENFVIAIGYFTSFFNETFKPYKEDWIFKEVQIIPYNKFCERMLLEKSNHAATAKLYRKSLFDNLRFQLNKKNEDTLFDADLISIIERNKFQCIDVPDYSYYYRQRNDSICHDESDPLEWHIYENMEAIIKRFKNRKEIVLQLRQKQLNIAVPLLATYIREKKAQLFFSHIKYIESIPNTTVFLKRDLKFTIYFLLLKYTPKLLYQTKRE